jgi:hypothetical protein
MFRLIPFILLLIAVPALAQDAVVPADRVTSHVNVRSAPSTDAMEVGRLNVGESARLIASVPRWYEIQLADEPRSLAFVMVEAYSRRFQHTTGSGVPGRYRRAHRGGTLRHLYEGGDHHHLQREIAGDGELLKIGGV